MLHGNPKRTGALGIAASDLRGVSSVVGSADRRRGAPTLGRTETNDHGQSQALVHRSQSSQWFARNHRVARAVITARLRSQTTVIGEKERHFIMNWPPRLRSHAIVHQRTPHALAQRSKRARRPPPLGEDADTPSPPFSRLPRAEERRALRIAPSTPKTSAKSSRRTTSQAARGMSWPTFSRLLAPDRSTS